LAGVLEVRRAAEGGGARGRSMGRGGELSFQGVGGERRGERVAVRGAVVGCVGWGGGWRGWV